jgi:hypothetical protein
MDGHMGSNQLALAGRSARIAVIAAVAITLLFVGLLLLERSGSSPVHRIIAANQSANQLAPKPSSTTTSTTINGTTTTTISKECHDDDSKTGEGPKDEDPDGECMPSGT